MGSGSSLRIFIKLKNQQTLRTACTCNSEQKQQLKSPGTTREGRGVGWEGGVPEEPALSAGPWATRKTRPAEGGAEKRLKPENHLPAEQEGHRSTAGRGLPGTQLLTLHPSCRGLGCLRWAGRPQSASCPKWGEVAARAGPARAGGPVHRAWRRGCGEARLPWSVPWCDCPPHPSPGLSHQSWVLTCWAEGPLTSGTLPSCVCVWVCVYVCTSVHIHRSGSGCAVCSPSAPCRLHGERAQPVWGPRARRAEGWRGSRAGLCPPGTTVPPPRPGCLASSPKRSMCEAPTLALSSRSSGPALPTLWAPLSRGDRYNVCARAPGGSAASNSVTPWTVAPGILQTRRLE